MRWVLRRGDEDKRLVSLVTVFVTLRIDVPTFYLWRRPQYVLWGARGNDVLIGSPADRARQQVLNRRARQTRERVTVVLMLRDSFTPTVLRLQEAVRAFERQVRPASQAVARFAEAQEAARREALRKMAEAVR